MNSAGSYQPITAESYAKLALVYAFTAMRVSWGGVFAAVGRADPA